MPFIREEITQICYASLGRLQATGYDALAHARREAAQSRFLGAPKLLGHQIRMFNSLSISTCPMLRKFEGYFPY